MLAGLPGEHHNDQREYGGDLDEITGFQVNGTGDRVTAYGDDYNHGNTASNGTSARNSTSSVPPKYCYGNER